MTADTSPSDARYRGMEYDYSAFTVNDDRNLTLLSIAEAENLLEHLPALPDGYYAIRCNGRRLLLTAAEVPPFVLAVFIMAGRDIRPIAYRTGLVSSEQQPTSQ